MCGFAGIVHWDGETVFAEELDQMSGRIRHRGPDQMRSLLPAPGVGLAHCRLMVIDLSDHASQPMRSPEKDLWLVYNGELYNFQSLRQELESMGIQFRSQSDTEVLIRSYEVWGTSAIPKWDGMFAAALWDSTRRELLLVRDRTGKKPLFYWTDGRCLVFGSEIKALLVHPHVLTEPDPCVLPHLLAYGYPPSGKTCYRQIRQVPAASFLRIREGQADPVPKRYWNLRINSGNSQRKPGSERTEELRALMTQAVKKRLIADVPLGAFLSGGVDSSVVVGLMSRQLSRPVKTFSIGFSDSPEYNEMDYARLAANRFGTDHTEFIVSPTRFDLLERLVFHHDQPFGDSSALPTYLLCELTRSKVTVALNGDGGDELFAGYLRFWAADLSERCPLWFRRLGRGLCQWAPSGESSRSVWEQARRFLQAAPEPLRERYFRWVSIFSDPNPLLVPEHRVPDSSLTEGIAHYVESGVNGSVLCRLLALNFHDYLPNDLHVKMDRCSMAHGLETRSPFMDTALIEWAAQLPDKYKLRGRTTKWIVREAFQDLLPAAIRRRGKMGFGVPLGSWFLKQWREPMLDLLGNRRSHLYRFLQWEAVESLIQRHLSKVSDESSRLWLLLTLELWLRQEPWYNKVLSP